MASTLDDITADSSPLLMYIEMDDVESMRSFDAEIGRILKYLKQRENLEIWQNSLLIITSDSNPFSVICGPRIPNKQRGIRSHALFDVWDTIIYGEESPRTEVPTQRVSNKEVVTRHV